MFANILRTQARLALTSCRARVPAFPISRVASRFPSVPSVSPTLRAISTTRPVWYNDLPVGNAESNTLYVGNLPYSATEEELKEKFEPFGAIQAIRIGYEADGRTRGFAHVEFADVHDAVAAYKSIMEEPMFILDRDIRVDYAAVRRQRAQPSMTLYFQGFRGTLDDMREATSDFGEYISDVFFLKDRETGKEYGSGFIHFSTVARAQEALEHLNGREYGDDVLRFRFASPPKRDRRRSRRDDSF
ncbi:hypothetical protein C0995_011618 [Termitomyces sp. Mi166|nr:hypothetical protein C0995_011618 [Termitomyces sp. Mi166\